MRAARQWWSALALGVVVGGLAATPVVSQNQPSALPGVFSEVLDVRVINLEVTVTDKRGTAILGLGPRDFRLLVDGEEVPIEYFSEVRGGAAMTSTRGDSLPAAPELTPGEPVGTSYLLFIDDFFSVKPDRDRVLQAMSEEIARLLPEDRMAVVAFDGERLEMLSTWSSSYSGLERVLTAARERPAHGLQRLLERRQFESTRGEPLAALFTRYGPDGDDLREPSPIRDLEPWERAYISRLTEQVDRAVTAAAATLRSFAKPPGRKVLILLAGGWPFVPAEYVVNDVSRFLFDRAGPHSNMLFGRLTETANLLGYTIYAVDVPGLSLETAGGAAESRLPSIRAGVAQDFRREQEVQDSLRFLARQTGGRALINAARVEVLPSVVSDTRSYYWLGFSPRRQRDDRYHDVAIELANPEFRARLRSGFLDSSPQTEAAMAVESALLFGSAAASESLQIEVGAAVPVESRRVEVPLTVSFDFGEITFLPVGEQWVANLELRIAVRDEQGRQALIPAMPMTPKLDAAPEPGVLGRYSTTLRIRRVPHDAVVAVHDIASGRILVAGARIEP